MRPMTPSRRLWGTASLFVVALACLGLASATHAVWPLFVAWIPLVAVPWLLTRPEAGRETGATQGGTEPGDAGEPTAKDAGAEPGS